MPVLYTQYGQIQQLRQTYAVTSSCKEPLNGQKRKQNPFGSYGSSLKQQKKRICLTISRFFATCFRHYVAKTRSRITTTVTFSRKNDASLCASIKNLVLVVVLVLESKLSYAYLCFINQDYLLTRYESVCNHPIILSNLQPTRRDHL